MAAYLLAPGNTVFYEPTEGSLRQLLAAVPNLLSITLTMTFRGDFLVAQLVKNQPEMQETLVRFLSREGPLENV